MREPDITPPDVRERLIDAAARRGLDVKGGKIRRTSSRFCLGVEHGDYNGTDLLGVGTDRFLWLAYKPNATGRVRLFSGNFPDDGVVQFALGEVPSPNAAPHESWARFPLGVDFVLRRAGFSLKTGLDGVILGNIPGGGMSRSASLALNLILTFLEVNHCDLPPGLEIVDLAQAVENDYIGSPCGKLDQIMILFARRDTATYYRPREQCVQHIPLGKGAADFRLVSLDTGTTRPGLENSTYRIRRAECEELVRLVADKVKIECLADVGEQALYDRIAAQCAANHPHLIRRLHYIFHAQQRFTRMLDAWRAGDMETVGRLFRADGLGLRDDYQISGPELETMCDLARSVPGVLGERMLGGGDKGAAGAIARADALDDLRAAIDQGFPRSHPELAERYAVHSLRAVDGVCVEELTEC